MSRDEWREARRDANRVGRFSVGWLLIVLLVLGVVGVGVWGFTAAVSDVKGRGDAVTQRNSGVNRVKQQALFNTYYQDIKATDRKLDAAADDLAQDPKDRVLKTNYTGMINYCNDVVGQYNTLARSYLAEEFRDADLPYQIDPNDPETDCKPSIERTPR
jgi:cytoskeletal protein RodZ